MFNPLTLVAPYDELTFLDKLPGYDSNRGVIEMLDLVREIQQSGNYYWQGASFPYGSQTLVAGGNTINGSIQVPPGSYITSVTVYNDYVVNPAGFKLSLYDKGSKAQFYYGSYELDRLCGSNMQQQVGNGASNPPSDPGVNGDNPFSPQFMMGPIIVTSPGVIGWEIVSLAPNGTNSQIQCMIAFAIPVNRQSIGQKLITK